MFTPRKVYLTTIVLIVVVVLASTMGRALAQDRVVATAKGDEDRIVQVESATVEDDESDAPIEIVPIPPGTVFEREVVYAEGASVTAGADQLIYSNTLGTFGAAPGANRLFADDITTTVPGGCNLRRYEFPVVGKVNPAGTGGSYTVDFAMYSSCPGSVPSASHPGRIIPGTQGQRIFIDQCQNATDDDGDTVVNDGCPAVGPPESGADCLNGIDEDLDGRVNDGCPAVGQAEAYVDSVPRLISFVPAVDAPLPTNFWFGVKFSRNNAGVVVGTPPTTGFSCDQWDYPGVPCDGDAGGFPDNPQASFNLEIYADSACANSYTGYKNNQPAGSLYNPGAEVFLADDIQLSDSGCNMIAYEVAVRGVGFYTFRMQNNCESGLIAGTEQIFPLVGTTDVQIVRFTFDPPIAIPQNFSFQAMISNTGGYVVIAGQQACIGSTADLLDTVVNGVCNQVLPEDLGFGIYGAINLTITCAVAAPVGACCDAAAPGGSCQDGVPESQCNASGDPQITWYKGTSCAAVFASGECAEHTGACCDHSPGAGGLHPAGVCTDNVLPRDCEGTELTWHKDETCADVVCVETTGACCDTLDGTCADNLFFGECQGDQRAWTEGASCADALCDATLGACCDHDPFGACAETNKAQCRCEKCVWNKLRACDQIECLHNSIPTVSAWGLVVLTLLLLTAAKIGFGRRPEGVVSNT